MSVEPPKPEFEEQLSALCRQLTEIAGATGRWTAGRVASALRRRSKGRRWQPNARGTESLQTPCWRKPDSNSSSLSGSVPLRAGGAVPGNHMPRPRRVTPSRDQWFESIPLQRGVICEPDFLSGASAHSYGLVQADKRLDETPLKSLTENSHGRPHPTRHSRKSGNPGGRDRSAGPGPPLSRGRRQVLVILSSFSVRY